MNLGDLRNPYDYANPVTTSNLFAGRIDALGKIAYMLDQSGCNAPVTYLAIHGQRAAGKTSLLNMTEFLAKERGYLTVRVDLVAGDSSPKQFFAKLYEELVGMVSTATELRSPDGREITPRLVRRITAGKLTDDGFPLEFPETLAGGSSGTPSAISEMALRKDLEFFAQQVGRPIVLLVDEAQVIAEQEHVLSVLRTLGTRLRGYSFVIAGTTDLVSIISEVFGPLLRQFELIAVERFVEDADVLNCISLPLLSLGLSPAACLDGTKSTAADLMRLTDGSAYEIQLYCHAMFAIWQEGKSHKMSLSPEAIDSVRLMLEAGADVQQHPMVVKIKAMPNEQLEALSILCASLDHGTIDELWFAYCLPGESRMTREDLDQHLGRLVEDGIIEIIDNRIHFAGDQFDEIYLRTWTLKRLSKKHPPLSSHQDFRHVLTRNVEYLLCNIRESRHRILTTCCYGMHPSILNRGLSQLAELPDCTDVNHSVSYLHEAIVACDIPEVLDLTTVTCSYKRAKAVRWLYAAGSENIELNEQDLFKKAASRVAGLGGELSSQVDHIELRPWAEMLEWIIKSTSSESTRREMSAAHADAAIGSYSAGDAESAIGHLKASYELAKSWQVANNLAYIMLKSGDYENALTWTDTAIELPCAPKQKALSHYNAAVALAARKNYAGASAQISEASRQV